MPQIKSKMKRMKISEKQRLRNRDVKSGLKTNISTFNKAFEAGDKKLCQEVLARAIKSLDKAVSKGVIHKNKAANQKSKLTVKFNSLPEKAPEPEAAPEEKKKKAPAKKSGAKKGGAKKTSAKKKTTKKTTAKKATSTAKKTTKAATAKKKTTKAAKKTTTKKTTKKSTKKK